MLFPAQLKIFTADNEMIGVGLGRYHTEAFA